MHPRQFAMRISIRNIALAFLAVWAAAHASRTTFGAEVTSPKEQGVPRNLVGGHLLALKLEALEPFSKKTAKGQALTPKELTKEAVIDRVYNPDLSFFDSLFTAKKDKYSLQDIKL